MKIRIERDDDLPLPRSPSVVPAGKTYTAMVMVEEMLAHAMSGRGSDGDLRRTANPPGLRGFTGRIRSPSKKILHHVSLLGAATAQPPFGSPERFHWCQIQKIPTAVTEMVMP